jgi:hypothetical protein
MTETGSPFQPSNTMIPPPCLAPESRSEKASFVIGIVALCFAALAAAWSLIGGAYCGWTAWGWAFIGFVLAIVSLALKQSAIGWWALGVSILAFVWVFACAVFLAGAVGTAAEAIQGGP